MAEAFNLTARINAQGPFGMKPVVDKIRASLQNIKVTVNIDIPKGVERRLDVLRSRLADINTQLNTISSSSAGVVNTLNQINAASTKNASSAQKTTKATKELNTVLAKTNRGAAEVAASIKGASTEIEEFGRVSGLAIRRFAGFSIATGVIFGLINSLRSGVSEAIAFERQIVRIAQAIKFSVNNLTPLTDEITRLSKTFGVASRDLADVSLILSQAGLTARETRVALDSLAKSALAPTFTDIRNTAEGAIAAMRQFRLSVDDLDSALGSINAVAAAFAVESDDIISAIRRTGGVFAAASAGIGTASSQLQEFISLFTSVRATTRESAESIATGLRTIFTRLQRRSTVDSLRELGIELTDTQGKFVGVFNAIRALNAGLDELDPKDIQFAAITEELGGFRQIGKTIPLITRFATAQEALKVAQGGVNSLTEDAIVAQQSLAVQIDTTREAFLALIRDFTNTSTFQTLARLVLNVTKTIISLADNIRPILPIITALATVKISSALSQFIRGFGRGARGQISPGSETDVELGKTDTAQIQSRTSNTKAVDENTRTRKQTSSSQSQITSEQISAILGNTTALIANTNAIELLSSTLRTASGLGANPNRRQFSTGGRAVVKQFRTGGRVGGKGRRDSQLILAEPGEFVVSRSGVNNIGLSNLLQANSGGFVKRVNGSNRPESISLSPSKLAKQISASELQDFFNKNNTPLPKGINSVRDINEENKLRVIRQITAETFDNFATKKKLSQAFGSGDNLKPQVGTAPRTDFIPSISQASGRPVVAALIAQNIGEPVVNQSTLSAGLDKLQKAGIVDLDSTNFRLPIQVTGLDAAASERGKAAMKSGISQAIKNTAKSILPEVDISEIDRNFQEKSDLDFNTTAGLIFESAISAAVGARQTSKADKVDFRGRREVSKLARIFGSSISDIPLADAKFTEQASQLSRVRANTINEVIQVQPLRDEVKRSIDLQRGAIKQASGGESFGIPALTTPGELVFSPDAVKRIGTKGLNKFNQTGDTSGLGRVKSSDLSIIPGVGNKDTFSTLLPEGSFVIRKAVSEQSGLIASRRAKRFASGGFVGKFGLGGFASFQAGGNVLRTASRIPGGAEILREVAQRLLKGANVGRKEIEAGLTAVARRIVKQGTNITDDIAEQVARHTIDRRRAAVGRTPDVVIGRRGRRGLDDTTLDSIRRSGRNARRNPGDAQADLDARTPLPEADPAQVRVVAEALRLAGNNLRGVQVGVKEFEKAIRGGADSTKAYQRAQDAATAASRAREQTRQRIREEIRRAGGSATVPPSRFDFAGRFNRFRSRFRIDRELEGLGDVERRQVIRERRARRTQGLLNTGFLLSLLAPNLIGNDTPGRAAISSGLIGGISGSNLGSSLLSGFKGGGLVGGLLGGTLGALITGIDAAEQTRLANAQQSLIQSTDGLDKAFKDFTDNRSIRNLNKLNINLGVAEDALGAFTKAQSQSLNTFGSVSSFFTQIGGIFTGGTTATSNIGGGVTNLDRALAGQTSGGLAVLIDDLTGDFRQIKLDAEEARKTFARNLFEQSKSQKETINNLLEAEIRSGSTFDDIVKRFGQNINVLALEDISIARQVSDAVITATAKGVDANVAFADALERLAPEQKERVFSLIQEKIAIQDATEAASERIQLLALRFNELSQAAQFALTAGQQFEILIQDIGNSFGDIPNISLRGLAPNLSFETDDRTQARRTRNISLLGEGSVVNLLQQTEESLRVLERIGPELLRQAAEAGSLEESNPELLAIDLFRRLNEFRATPASFQDAFVDALSKVFTNRQGSSGPAALRQALVDNPESILETIRTSIGQAAINAQNTLDQTFQSIANNFTQAANLYIKAQLDAAEAADKIIELENIRISKIREISGQEPLSFANVDLQLRNQLQALTGRFGGNQTDTVDNILNNIRSLLVERAGLNQQRQQDNITLEELRRLDNALIQNQLRLDQNTKALNLVASETARLAAIESELANIQKRRESGLDLVEQLAGAQVDPRANIELRNRITNALALLGQGRLSGGEGGANQLKDAVGLLRQLGDVLGGDAERNLDDIINRQLGKIAGINSELPDILKESLQQPGTSRREQELTGELNKVFDEQRKALEGQGDISKQQNELLANSIDKLIASQIESLRSLSGPISVEFGRVLQDTLNKQKIRQLAIEAAQANINTKETRIVVNQNQDDIQGQRRGGIVSGIFKGDKDTELRKLVPGEFVVKRSVAQKVIPQLSALNRGVHPEQAFRTGGPVLRRRRRLPFLNDGGFVELDDDLIQFASSQLHIGNYLPDLVKDKGLVLSEQEKEKFLDALRSGDTNQGNRSRAASALLRIALNRNQIKRSEQLTDAINQRREASVRNAELRARQKNILSQIQSGEAPSGQIINGDLLTFVGDQAKLIIKDDIDKERDAILKYGIFKDSPESRILQHHIFKEVGLSLNEIRSLANQKFNIGDDKAPGFIDTQKQALSESAVLRLNNIRNQFPEFKKAIDAIESEQQFNVAQRDKRIIQDLGQGRILSATAQRTVPAFLKAISPTSLAQAGGRSLIDISESDIGTDRSGTGEQISRLFLNAIGQGLNRSGLGGERAFNAVSNAGLAGLAGVQSLSANQLALYGLGDVDSKAYNEVISSAVKNVRENIVKGIAEVKTGVPQESRDFVSETIARNQNSLTGQNLLRFVSDAGTGVATGSVLQSGGSLLRGVRRNTSQVLNSATKDTIEQARNDLIRKIGKDQVDQLDSARVIRQQAEQEFNRILEIDRANAFTRDNLILTPQQQLNQLVQSSVRRSSIAKNIKNLINNFRNRESRRRIPLSVFDIPESTPRSSSGFSFGPGLAELSGLSSRFAPRTRRVSPQELVRSGVNLRNTGRTARVVSRLSEAQKSNLRLQREARAAEQVNQGALERQRAVAEAIKNKILQLPSDIDKSTLTLERFADIGKVRRFGNLGDTFNRAPERILSGKTRDMLEYIKGFETPGSGNINTFEQLEKYGVSLDDLVKKFEESGVTRASDLTFDIFKQFKPFNIGGSVDNVLAALTPGEFVVRKEVAQKHADLLERLNRTGNIPKFQRGGFVDSRFDIGKFSSIFSQPTERISQQPNTSSAPPLPIPIRVAHPDDPFPVDGINAINNFSTSISSLSSVLGGLSNLADVSNQLARASQMLNNINIPTTITMEVAPIQVNVVHNGAEVFSRMNDSIRSLIESTVNDAIRKHINIITGETNEVFSGSAPGQIR